jgi:hypothetical protein
MGRLACCGAGGGLQAGLWRFSPKPRRVSVAVDAGGGGVAADAGRRGVPRGQPDPDTWRNPMIDDGPET